MKELISAVKKYAGELDAAEETLHKEWLARLEEYSSKLSEADESQKTKLTEELVQLARVFASLPPSLVTNSISGSVHSLIIKHERSLPTSVLPRLLTPEQISKAHAGNKKLLIIKPGISSTKVTVFKGIRKITESEIHLSPDIVDSIDTRVEQIRTWIEEEKLELGNFDGIACRCGFIQPVPTGTYRLAPEMLKDLENAKFIHASNMSVSICMKLAELSGKQDDILLTTSDPVVSDEIETVERLTGYVKVRRDGSGAHYLNHKAVMRILASIIGKPEGKLGVITAHLGNGISVVVQRENRITAVIDAFADIPTTYRSGPIHLPKLIEMIKKDQLTLKELESVVFSRGGLLSLAGTNDFRTLEGFRNKGASLLQKKKIDLILDFFARQITSAILRLSSDGKPVEVVALTGGLARSEELVKRIRANLAGRYPLVLIPGSVEPEALSAGLIKGFYDPSAIKDYVKERDTLRQKRREEDKLIESSIFDRKVIYRKKGAPIVSIDDLIDATRITVKDNYLPSIAIVGAENEDAVIASKKANEEGNYRIAKFHLVGDYTAINQIAYDYDLVIDNDNYIIHDSDNPVEDAIKLLDGGSAHILMKGSVKTDQILRGVFQYLKSNGKIKPGELISHVFVMDIPVRNKLLLISDAAVNTYPDEEKKVKIIENTLRVANHLNIKKPKVAIISAIESVSKNIESSIDAERIAGRFSGRDDCIVEGPLSFDVAMNQKIAGEKHYKGVIRGNADILIMPDIDAGNVLYKSLTTQSGAASAGVILCSNMPLVLASRGDSARSKLASLSLAVKLFFDLKED